MKFLSVDWLDVTFGPLFLSKKWGGILEKIKIKQKLKTHHCKTYTFFASFRIKNYIFSFIKTKLFTN